VVAEKGKVIEENKMTVNEKRRRGRRKERDKKV
jgi:hypothetical protein